MADHFSKLWLQRSLNQNAIQRAAQAIENLGRALPCRVTAVNGAIVTVAFEVDTSPWTLPPITISKAESQWIRTPTQVDDKGITVPSDAYLGGISGLGSGTADMRQRGNLSALVFVPVSNAHSGPIDPNAAQIQGPNGAIIQTTQGDHASSAVINQNNVTLTHGQASCVLNNSEAALCFGNTSLVINASGIALTFGEQTIVLNSSGLMINGESYKDHTHGYFPGTGSKTQTDPPAN